MQQSVRTSNSRHSFEGARTDNFSGKDSVTGTCLATAKDNRLTTY
jgi:hypothetical protein